MARDEVRIGRRELETLHRKAVAHDDYLAAVRSLRESHAAALRATERGEASPEVTGYLRAFRDLSAALLRAQRERIEREHQEAAQR